MTSDEETHLPRGLHQRHISLIAIAGRIEISLFLRLGFSIQQASPIRPLLAYATIGLIACAVQFALGEVRVLLPVSGSFVPHVEVFVDPAIDLAIDWNII